MVLSDIESSLRNGILTNGPKVKELEKKFSEYIGTKHAVAVSSGAASLEIPLRYFGVKDREVIVPTNTFVATPNSVVFAGGRPVFADMREDTLCIDPEDIESRISPKTAGIIVVHIAGLVCPQINEIRKLCNDLDLFLLEDCAHSHGATINEEKAGTFGEAGCFSFGPTKVMTTGEGGILVTNEDRLAEKAHSMRNRGLDSENLMIMLGHSWCMSEINAILGLRQLDRLDLFVARRNEIAQEYERQLTGMENVSLIKTPSNVRHSYHKFPVRISDEINVEKVRETLKKEHGIETGRVYYPPCHMHPYYREYCGTGEGNFPIAERVLKQILCLPIHLEISRKSVRDIVNSLDSSILLSKQT